NVLTVTRLADTASAVTTSMTYTGNFDRVASVTDPLGRQTTFTYDLKGNLTQATDANGNASQFGYDNAGRLIQATNPLGKQSTLTYDGADLVRVTDALNRSVSLVP